MPRQRDIPVGTPAANEGVFARRANRDGSVAALLPPAPQAICNQWWAPLRAAALRGEVRLEALARGGYPGRALPPRMLPEMASVGFWDASGPQTWGLDWHCDNGLELSYLARGKTPFSLEGEHFMLESGQVAITCPWQRHRLGNPNIGGSRLCWLILDIGARVCGQEWRWPAWLVLPAPDLRRLSKLLTRNRQPVWRANEATRACFERMSKLIQAPEPVLVQTRLQLYVSELLLEVREMLEQKEDNSEAELAPALRAVEEFLGSLPHHLEKAWTLEEMARQCGLGASAFTEYCRRITNSTPGKYLVRSRVEAAARLLRSEARMSVTEIALACGFQSSQYLATVFRRSMGSTPSAYRRARLSAVGGLKC